MKTDAERHAEIEERAGTFEITATDVRYDRERRAIVLTLPTSAELAVPVASIPSIANASDEDLSDVRLESTKIDVRWERLDEDIAIGTIVRDATGITQILGRAGRVKTPKKAASSRENGKKGGRPRKTPAPT